MFHFGHEPTGQETRHLIDKAFHRYSSALDKSLLFKTDFKCAWLYLFGYKIAKYELCEYYQSLGKNYYEDGVSFKEFERKALGEVKRLDSIEELRNAFIALDFACKGFLTQDDIQKQFDIVAPKLGKRIVNDVFAELDRDGDGRVSYKDFEFAMLFVDDE